MNISRTKLITLLLAFGCIGGSIIAALLHNLLPAYYSNWYVEVFLFFLVMESYIVVYIDRASQKKTQRQLVNLHLLTKLIKIFVSLLIIGIYALAIKEGLNNFALIYMLLYLLFLAIESYLFLKIEKRLKEKTALE